VAAATGFIVSVYDLDLAQLGERVLPLPIRVGRSSLNDVCVSHRLVSEFHARIEEVDGRLCVRDLSSKNGVLVETVGSDGARRVAAQTPVELEPYGYEFLLSPLLRVRVRPATGREPLDVRHSHALGSVLGNVLAKVHGDALDDAGLEPVRKAAAFHVAPAVALAEDQLTEGFVQPPAGSAATDFGAGGRLGAFPAPARGNVARPSPVPAALATASLGAPPISIPAPPTLPPPTLPPLSQPLVGAGGHARSGSAPPRPTRSLSQTAPQGSPRSLGPDGPAPSPGGMAAGGMAAGGMATAGMASGGTSPAVQPYSSVFVEPPAGSLELPPLPASARNGELSYAPAPASVETRFSPPPPAARATLLEPSDGALQPSRGAPEPPHLAHTAWEVGPGTLPAAAVQAARPTELPGRSLEALALRGLRELATSLVPGQTVETASDVVQLVTKLHDAIEMFCRCFIPVREACSRFIPTDELERAAIERCRHGSPSYVAIERALEPRAVAAALLDWRNDHQDAPRAVEHILADLMLHHLALSQAALEGTRALLDELSPARIESQQPAPTPTMLSRLGLAGTREKDLWEAFARRHADLEAIGRAFRTLFGDSFTRAYVAQAPVPGSGPSL
jgi:predicted component of type VI protein secretion system